MWTVHEKKKKSLIVDRTYILATISFLYHYHPATKRRCRNPSHREKSSSTTSTTYLDCNTKPYQKARMCNDDKGLGLNNQPVAAAPSAAFSSSTLRATRRLASASQHRDDGGFVHKVQFPEHRRLHSRSATTDWTSSLALGCSGCRRDTGTFGLSGWSTAYLTGRQPIKTLVLPWKETKRNVKSKQFTQSCFAISS